MSDHVTPDALRATAERIDTDGLWTDDVVRVPALLGRAAATIEALQAKAPSSAETDEAILAPPVWQPSDETIMRPLRTLIDATARVGSGGLSTALQVLADDIEAGVYGPAPHVPTNVETEDVRSLAYVVRAFAPYAGPDGRAYGPIKVMAAADCLDTCADALDAARAECERLREVERDAETWGVSLTRIRREDPETFGTIMREHRKTLEAAADGDGQ